MIHHSQKVAGDIRNRLRRKQDALAAIIVLVAVVAVTVFRLTEPARSQGIDSVVTTLSTETAGAESKVTVVFTPQTALAPGDVITVYLGEVGVGGGGDPWVDTGGTISSVDVLCSQTDTTFVTPGGYVQTDATNTSPLIIGCTVNAVNGGGNTALTISVGDGAGDDLNNPGGADGYSIAVTTNDDSGAGIAYVGHANDVTVTTNVLPNLSLTIDNADGSSCVTTTGVTACNLGTVTTAAVNEGYYDVNVGTNAATGASMYLEENTDLLSGLEDIDDVVENNPVTLNVEGYGIEITTVDAPWGAIAPFDDNDTPITGAPADEVARSVVPVGYSDDVTVTHRVAVDSAVQALTYTHIVTWTGTANF